MSKIPPDSRIDEPGIVISVAEGKYTFIQRPNGHSLALRHGSSWVDEFGVGSNVLLAFAYELQAARARIKQLEQGYDEPAPRRRGLMGGLTLIPRR